MHRSGLALVAGLLLTGPASAQESRRPEVWGVVIGVGSCVDRSIPATPGAPRDARAVADWLIRTAGWPRDHVRLLEDRGGPELVPTKVNLDRAVRQWLPSQARPGDLVLIYYAGQAVPLPLGDRAAPEEVSAIGLLPGDALLADPATAWDLDQALDPLAAAGDRTVLVVLDTAPMGRGRVVAADARRKVSADAWLRRLARWPGVTAWLASSERPAPDEASDGGRAGAFVSGWIAAMGKADRPRSLASALGQINQDPQFARRGFRSLGGIAPHVTLWADRLLAPRPQSPELVRQRGQGDRVTALIATGDGAEIIGASEDGTIRTARANGGGVLRVDSRHLQGVTALALSDDGRFLASADRAGVVRFWDREAGRAIVRDGPPAHAMPVGNLSALPDAASFLSIDAEGVAVLWDLAGTSPTSHHLPRTAARVAVARRPCAVPILLIDAEGQIHTCDARGRTRRTLDGPGGAVTAAALSPGAERLAVADEQGRMIVSSASATDPAQVIELPFGIACVGFSPDATTLAVGGAGLILIRPDGGRTSLAEAAPGADDWIEIEFSPDGTGLVARRAGGQLAAWRLDGPEPVPIPLEGANSVPTTALMIAPDGRRLLVGDADGGLSAWDLRTGRREWRAAPARGAIVGAAVAPDGSEFVQFTRDGHALRWDLGRGRGPKLLEGRWGAGAYTADGKALVLTREAEAGGEAWVVGRDGRSGHALPRPDSADGRPSRVAFGAVHVAGGRVIAAGRNAPALACIWDLETRKLVRTIRPEGAGGPVTAAELSGDGKRALVASEDGRVEVWDLDAGEVQRLGPVQGPRSIAAAALRPGTDSQLATGSHDGEVLLWNRDLDKPFATLNAGEGAVGALTWGRDGSWLAASGGDHQVRIWQVGAAPGRPERLSPAPNHEQPVTTLLAWPDGKALLSAGRDGQVRLWDVAGHSLRGTYGARVLVPESDPKREGIFPIEWVVATPGGAFDASNEGETAVAWRVGEELRSLDQFYDVPGFHDADLAAKLARGEVPPAPSWPKAVSARVALDRIGDTSLVGREAGLRIGLGDLKRVAQVRLYHNGVPIPAEALEPPLGSRIDVRVRLRSGENRFYALATTPGAIDARSQEVMLRYEGPEPAGTLHVLAIGIDRYGSNALRYAGKDAEAFAGWLRSLAAAEGRSPGAVEVLRDAEVSPESVRAALLRIRDQVREHPEDKVVLFLAGHAGVVDDRFCLMLPEFPFPAGGPTVVALRGADLPPATTLSEGVRGDVLPYATIFADLARLGALERLVVVDACEAAAIADDPGVRRLERLFERGARTARTAYLFAARRGEPAREAAALEHGLFTFALLKGLGKPDLGIPTEFNVFGDAPHADRDGDRTITTAELRAYADRFLPALASRTNEATRQAAPIRGNPTGPIPQLRGSEPSFPLVTLPE